MTGKTHPSHFHILAAIVSTIAVTIFLVQAVKPQTRISTGHQLNDTKPSVSSKQRLQSESNGAVRLDKVNAKVRSPVTRDDKAPKQMAQSLNRGRVLQKRDAIAQLRSADSKHMALEASFEKGVPISTLRNKISQANARVVEVFYKWGDHYGGYRITEDQTVEQFLTDVENKHLQFLQRHIQNLSNYSRPTTLSLSEDESLVWERAVQQLRDEFSAQLELFKEKGLVVSGLIAEDNAATLVGLVETFPEEVAAFQVSDSAETKTNEALKFGDQSATAERSVTTTAAAGTPYPNEPWKFSPARGQLVYDANSKTFTSYFSWDDVSGFTAPHIAYEHDITIFESKDSYIKPNEDSPEWHSNLPNDSDTHSNDSTLYRENRFGDKYTVFSIGTAAARSIKIGAPYYIEIPVTVVNENLGPTTGAIQPQLGSWAGEYDDGDADSEFDELSKCVAARAVPFQNDFANCIFNDQTHTLVNYFDGSGVFVNFLFDHRKSVTYNWDRTSSRTPATLSCPQEQYKAEYTDKEIGKLVYARCESAPINYSWADKGPGFRDHFEAKWTGRFNFPQSGNYRFIAASDDGMRVYVDNSLIIDSWRDRSETEERVDRSLSAGVHEVRVEYYENGGQAAAKLRWEFVGTTSPSCNVSVAANRWKGEYFNNVGLSGSPVMVRDDSAANGMPFFAHSWGTGSPSSSCGVNSDNFSSRWTRRQFFEAGRYRFTIRTDDGMRLFIDNALKLDRWSDQPPTNHSVDVDLTSGEHDLKVEYYERTGGAVAQIFWERISANGGYPTVAFSMSGGGQSGTNGQTLTYSVPAGGNVTITFDGSSSIGGSGSISSYDWRSNNTSISAQRSFNFTFGRGTHNISLTVRNSAGLASTATGVIVVNEQVASAPTARFTMSGGGQSGANGQTLTYSVPAGGNVTITFDAANSIAGSGSISSYDWRSNNTSISTQRSFNFTFGRGTHNISLTVRNSAGLASTATGVIVVNEQVASAPTARFTMSGGGQSGANGQTLTYSVPAAGNVTISFDAVNSVAGSGSISSYDWRSNNTSISAQRNFSFTFGRGTHNISLTVRNSAGLSSTATGVIVVNEQVASAPTARFTMSGGGKSGTNGQTLTYSVPVGGNVTMTFDAASSVAGSGSISSYDWRSNNTSISSQRSFNFTFGRGTHNISLTVRNSAGLTSTATGVIVINETSCPGKFCIGDTVTVFNTGGAGLRLRQCASTNSTTCPVIVTMADGTRMQVFGGPVTADGFIWWAISGNVNGTFRTGWAVQDFLTR